MYYETIQIDFNSDEAIYIQLRNQIILGIATSRIQEGDTLPSVRQLADNIGINMHTVNKAYSVLRQEGFLSIDRALLLDFQATLETKPEKAIKLEKDALAQIETITADNARLVSNLHANLGGLYRMNAHPDLAREHMEKSISLLDQFNLLHINDSIPQIANYAMFLTKQQEPERGISELQKLSGIIKEYHSDDCLDYAKVQETLGTIYLMTANLPQAKTHFKRAFKIYEKIWADEPEMIEAKYQEIQELYPQIGFCIGKNLSGLLTK